MKRRIFRILGVLLLTGGLIAFLLPNIKEFFANREADSTMESFLEAHPAVTTPAVQPTQSSAVPDEPTEPTEPDDPFWQQCKAYNQHLFETGQSDLTDAWKFAQNPFPMELEDDLFGIIELPTMDVTMPLYLGATAQNMLKGMAVLGQSSLPIGGINTNSVIAGHRGYNDVMYIRNIEEVQVGDPIYVTNPWQRLEYRVESIHIIEPYEIEAIYIQPGRDMITISTCHPYGSGGRYRYLLYCVRAEEIATDDPQPTTEATAPTQVYHPRSSMDNAPLSAEEIHQEDLARKIGAGIIGFLLLLLLLPIGKKKKPAEADKSE